MINGVLPATTKLPPTVGDSGAADRNLQDLACGQAEVAADLGTETTFADYPAAGDDVAALRAKGRDLIGVGGRHREVDEAPSVGKVEWGSTGARPRRDQPGNCHPSQRQPFHFGLPNVQNLDYERKQDSFRLSMYTASTDPSIEDGNQVRLTK
jgi:hypothetical protein